MVVHLSKIMIQAFLICLCIASLIGSSYATQTKPYVCKGQYALCTKAECFPIPGQPNNALCHCKTETGYSASYKPCEKPKKDKRGYTSIKSRYYPADSHVECSNHRPWAFCLDSPCIIDPKDPSKSMCTCSIVEEKGTYVLPTDTCDQSKCITGLWSSALKASVVELISQLHEAIEEGKLPATQSKFCQ